MRASFPERVAARAQQVSVARLLLSLLALPFYVLGLVAGVLLVAGAWVVSAAALGVEDVRSRARRGDG